MILRGLLLCAALITASARANDMTQATADVSPELFKGRALKKIPDLTWDEKPATVEYMILNGRTIPVAKYRGTVPSLRGSSLIYSVEGSLRTAKVSEEDASVEIYVPLTSNRVAVRLRAINQYGQTFDDAIIVSSVVKEKFAGKRLNMDAGLGLSYLNYVETFRTQKFAITEIGLTVKTGINYQLSHKWEIGGNGFVTAYPFTLSSSPAGLLPARWFGLNGRAGYRFAQPSPRASYHVLAGWYIWGMLTSATSRNLVYGVERLGGPQVFVTGRFRLNNGRAFNSYVKFATIQDQGIFSATNRELAVGVSYQITPPVEGRRRWMATLDIANAQYARLNQSFRLNSYSLGVGTNF